MSTVVNGGEQDRMRSQIRLSKSISIHIAGDGSLKRLVRRNLSVLGGLAGLAAAALLAVSMATWAVDDPSLSHANEQQVRNLLGYPGAVVSDLMIQLFGLAAPVILVPPVVWAWRAVFAKPTLFVWSTAATWFVGTLAVATAMAASAVPGSWPLQAGLGGVVGDLLLKAPGFFMGGEPTGVLAFAAVVVFASASVALMLHACGLILRFDPSGEDDEEDESDIPEVRPSRRVIVEDEAEEAEEDDEADADNGPGRRSRVVYEDYEDDTPSRLALFAGAVGHLILALLAGLQRLFGRAKRHRLEASFERAAGARQRIEPRLNADGEWYAPEDEDEPDADELAGFDDSDEGMDPDPEDDDEDVPPPVARKKKAAAPQRRSRKVEFELPSVELLAQPKAGERKTTISEAQLEGVLDDFGVKGEIINVRPGPVVTLYELEPAPGIKSSRVIGLADDIARSMSAIACRVAVIPGKNAIGIELPNAKRETVYLRELLDSEDFVESKARLGLCLGKTIGGEPVIADLARMPHLLVAGTTGSGKSVSVNTMILSLLYRWTPAECRLIMIDPKMLELSIYDGIPHLLTPVVTDPKQAVVALKWTVREMEDRYRKMSKLGVRNVDGYNARLAQALAKGETLTRTVQTGFDPDTGEAIYEKEALSLDPLPFIVVIIDEMADLMMVAGKDIEGAVQRLAQMARAAGIHVVMATQRPSVDVITGTIKANFPTRISFQVTSKIDSRTILGEQGAEQLLGQGDMLYMMGGGRIQRVHGPFVSDREVEEVVAHLKEQGAPDYLHAITVDDEASDGGMDAAMDGGGEESNDLYDRAVAIVLRDRKASTSYIQRRLAVGYNRAASIIEKMEQEGVVGPANHAGKREILVPEDGEAAFR
jgi:DNA segregation ATPase FtsK/SpoIIIE, S-DNA-T family